MSSFGFGGTNAHAVLTTPPPTREFRNPTNRAFLLGWSVSDPSQFGDYQRDLASALRSGNATLEQFGAALSFARPSRAHRRWAVAESKDEAAVKVERGGDASTPHDALRPYAEAWANGDSAALRAANSASKSGDVRIPVSPWWRQRAYVEPKS